MITLMIASAVSLIFAMATAKPEDLSHAWIDGFFIFLNLKQDLRFWWQLLCARW